MVHFLRLEGIVSSIYLTAFPFELKRVPLAKKTADFTLGTL
jgi:hypothetical protein